MNKKRVLHRRKNGIVTGRLASLFIGGAVFLASSLELFAAEVQVLPSEQTLPGEVTAESEMTEESTELLRVQKLVMEADWIVTQNGEGHFTTISEAATAAAEGDTILVFPGIYEEAVIIPEKELTIIGLDKETCILQNCFQSYMTPPLEIAAGTVKDMTIYSYRPETEVVIGKDSNGALVNEDVAVNDVALIYEGVIPASSFSNYAVHVESDYSYGRTLTFENCILKSDCNYVVGAGLRGDFTMQFIDCELLGRGTAGNIYMHDTRTDKVGLAKVLFERCRFRCEMEPYFMSTCSYRADNRVDMTFREVKIEAVGYQDKEIYSVSNLYTGQTIDELAGQYVEKLNLNKSGQYLSAVRTLSDDVYEVIEKPKAVTYVKDTNILKDMTWEEALRYDYKDKPGMSARKRVPINVWNIDGIEGTGWCGSNNFYITWDSYGNSLPELNAAMLSSGVAPLHQEVTVSGNEIPQEENDTGF